MKMMVLIITVLFPDIKAHTTTMVALQGALDIEHCRTVDIPRFLKQYANEVPYALDIHARCVIIDINKPVNPKGMEDKEEEKEEKEKV